MADLSTTWEQKTEDCDTLKFEWRELYHLALKHHGSISLVFQHVLSQHQNSEHTELESMYHQYVQCRFQWLFTYWLFRQPAPYNKQLRSIFLQWKKHSKRKVATWGETLCDVRYLASLHPVTKDYWRGQLARGDESLGIQTVGNYFSMCKSLVAWILGRDWGRLKRRKVYEDTLEGVYLLLRREMQETLVEHERFWQVAKVQMTRVCTLEETAANYVNWKMIETLPYYKSVLLESVCLLSHAYLFIFLFFFLRLYLVSGNSVYLDHVQGFLRRKRLIRDWIYMEENSWARQLLPESLYTLLEFDTKISQESLHGDCVTAQLSRLMWLYLNSGQELYLQALKGMVLQCAHACLGHLNALQACQVPVA
ncbi:oocyte-specific F-box [Labeo rohita]|uniref:Oocyte-specific F-box n=1 Tax=Labeo rohita TaxID=84645 RepID=A0A498L7N9_LABRO|nr:oocyte-specific F-box [Labeo rohita]